MKTFDKSYLNKKIKFIAGVDEAGRGPLAGPVVASAVIFDAKTIINDVTDSKKLSEKKREYLFDEIYSKALSVGIGIIDEREIDKINILQATLKAMAAAVNNLTVTPDLILIDGNKVFNSPIPCECI
ncbi:ribonuclease HII, partial [Patescibacteria group bacterium]|nr:ribonuclease HII [Patescibacteria group bacterium]